MSHPSPPKFQEVKATLTIPQEGIAKLIMGETKGAQATDYSGSRLDPVKAEELYEKLYRMRLRGVENKSLLSRSLGLSYNTVVAWCQRFDCEMRRKENDRMDIIERNKMIAKLDELQQALWQIYASENTPAGVKVSAMNAVSSAVMKQAELMGLPGNLPNQNWSVRTQQILMNPKEIEDAKRIAEGISALLAEENV
jgi:hypothetical protein